MTWSPTYWANLSSLLVFFSGCHEKNDRAKRFRRQAMSSRTVDSVRRIPLLLSSGSSKKHPIDNNIKQQRWHDKSLTYTRFHMEAQVRASNRQYSQYRIALLLGRCVQVCQTPWGYSINSLYGYYQLLQSDSAPVLGIGMITPLLPSKSWGSISAVSSGWHLRSSALSWSWSGALPFLKSLMAS